MRSFIFFGLAVLGVLAGLAILWSFRKPAVRPTQGVVGVFPFDVPNGPPREDLARELAGKLTTERARIVVLPAAQDAQAAAAAAGMRMYVVGLAKSYELNARLFDVTAPAGPRAEAKGKTVDELAAQLRGGILGAAVHEQR